MAKTGLTKEQYMRYIKLQLGAPIIWIELEDFLDDIIDMAFQELKGYITDCETMTVPYANVIDLAGKKIASISYVMRGSPNISVSGLQDMMYIYTSRNRTSGVTNSFTLSDYARALMVQQNKNALSTDLDFMYDRKNEKLYLYEQKVVSNTVTLVYTPEYEDVSEIYEEFWINLLKRLSLAMTKEALGRVRGKYTLGSATYNLDADQLLGEAQAELTEIRTFLNSNKDLLLPMD